MILVDLNQVMISNLMVQLGNQAGELDESLFRHMILNSLRSNRTKFTKKFGELVICCDDKNFWRRQRYPYYKANRKKYRDESGVDWSTVFNTLNKVREEIKEFFPYKVIKIDTAEADDVIGTIVTKYHTTEPILILSGDKDFIQLHKFKDVKQYDPVHKKFLKDKSPEQYLIEHKAKGDRGDGVPNYLSADDTFVIEGGRQKPLRAKYIEVLGNNINNIEEKFEDEELKRGWMRNRMLIDLSYIPQEIQSKVVESFDQPTNNRSKLFNYFVKHKLKHLMEDISEF